MPFTTQTFFVLLVQASMDALEAQSSMEDVDDTGAYQALGVVHWDRCIP